MPTESFFNFFDPPSPPQDDDDATSDIEERLELDYQLGEDIKEKLIPRAIDWFTGEALQYENFEDFDEGEFEALLWGALQHLHDHDDTPWAEGVAADRDNPHFAFSVAGTAFFVVGLHPNASRVARRAPVPTLVFNLHEQFERLRASGRFDRMRDTIRERDERLQGSINPMVSDHGTASEARQYSGREVDDSWLAPFESAS